MALEERMQHHTSPIAAATAEKALLGPVAIGGVGGSGTRVVAQLLLDCSFYLGGDLNEANDNLWFSLILKRPDWLRAALDRGDQADIARSIAIFARALRGLDPLTAEDFAYLTRAAIEVCYPHDHSPVLVDAWCLERLETLRSSAPVDWSGQAGWGWKEPNTHMLLPHLGAHLPGLTYIHLVRNGLDMAYSGNQAQLRNWGHWFGVETPSEPALLPKASLEYWIRANRAAIVNGARHLGDRFLLVNYDRLCADPRGEIPPLLRFIGVDPAAVELDRLAAIPRVPASAGRYKAHDLSIFSADQLEAVRSLGFPVD
jgi:sulfotransferase family protein